MRRAAACWLRLQAGRGMCPCAASGLAAAAQPPADAEAATAGAAGSSTSSLQHSTSNLPTPAHIRPSACPPPASVRRSPDTVRAGFRVIFSYDWRGKGETAEEAAAPAPAPAAAEEEADEEVAAAPAPAPVAAEQAAAGDARRNGPRVPRKAGPKKPAGTATTAAPAPAAAPTSVADKATLEAAADILSSIPARGAGGKKPRGVTKPAAAAAPAPAPAAAEAEAEEEEAAAAAPAPATSDAATAAAAPALAPTAELLTDPGLATADEIIDGAAAAPAPALAAAADILASIPIPGSEAAPEPKRPRGRRQGADVGAEWWVSDSELREDAQELEEADDPWWREDI